MVDGCQASLSPSWCEEAAGADGGEGSQDLEPLLPVGRAAVEASDVPSSAAVASVSDSSTAVFVEDPEIPRLLERIERLVADGFQETRVFEAQPHFIKDVVKVPFQLILTHSCVVLGPAGAGKTTLVKALGGEKFKPSVPAGPHLKNRTVQAQACDLQLEGLTDDLNFVLIDTPGWNHDTSTNIKSQYKSILKEKTLVSEHTPHIIVFCVPVSAIRQFQMKEAKKMSEELQELKFDKRFPIKVLPVATMADTQQPEELPELLSTIKDLAKKAFQETGAEVEEPLSTRFPPGGDPQGVEELSARLRQVLHSQLRSEEFCHLWQKAFAKGIVSSVREHCEKFPENDSTLRLFKKACCTVAAACGKQVSGLGGLNGSTATDQLPWSALQDLPTFDRQTWQPPPLGEGRSIVRMWGWASAAVIWTLSVALIRMRRDMGQMAERLKTLEATHQQAQQIADQMTQKYNEVQKQLVQSSEDLNHMTLKYQWLPWMGWCALIVLALLVMGFVVALVAVVPQKASHRNGKGKGRNRMSSKHLCN